MLCVTVLKALVSPELRVKLLSPEDDAVTRAVAVDDTVASDMLLDAVRTVDTGDVALETAES